MNRVSLIEELNYKNNNYKTKTIEEDTETELITLVDNIIKEFTQNRSYLINDTENRKLPEESLKSEIINYIDKNGIRIDETNRAELIKKVKDYLFGYYVLQDLVDNEDVSDIRVLSYRNVQVKVRGKRVSSQVKFPSKESFDIFYNYLVVKLGGVLDKKNALQILSDNTDKFYLRISLSSSFVNSIDNAYVSIRKIPKNKLQLEQLMLRKNMFDRKIYDYLIERVQAGVNILLCGKGGSGKTTLINALLDKVPYNKATLIVQESEELFSNHPNMMFQKEKISTGNSDAEYSLNDFSRFAMTEDLDMIVIGEIKGKEALSLFKVIGTGHDGWSSVHANSAEEAIDKLTDYMLEGNPNLNRYALLKLLAAVDIIIFMRDFKVMEVTEVAGFNEDSKELDFNPVFKFNKGSFEKLNDSCEKVQRKIQYYDYFNGGDK
ncbi:ATPase, T2SS/T4P/T4SS family [Clostridium felsineum]|uniref:Bacterial type II secretion system protein E domain-containing protein n=1 Tax=Clostridium felsineum TaxID=36839 RepID=A0A1S8LB64_9CLOT|nr:ATPase, T2SS/T4P/T4SS family [Clostridium felsineum]URZ05893.1 hypothetical protein CLROS_012250 [Clostridium felsineum]URZ10930.1 hypothetical protein CROST_016460 [Clostridium felsineum]